MKKILTFGVFDNLHEGHKNFLCQAKKLGDYLVVAIAKDEIVWQLKNKHPQNSINQRIDGVKKTLIADEVTEGDGKTESWHVIEKYCPDVIALGYDQNELREALEKFLKEKNLNIEIKVTKPHKPGKYHSSILENYS